MPKSEPVPRPTLFTDSEVHALVNALGEWVPVFAHGKYWNDVAVAAIKLLEEFKKHQATITAHPNV